MQTACAEQKRGGFAWCTMVNWMAFSSVVVLNGVVWHWTALKYFGNTFDAKCAAERHCVRKAEMQCQLTKTFGVKLCGEKRFYNLMPCNTIFSIQCCYTLRVPILDANQRQKWC